MRLFPVKPTFLFTLLFLLGGFSVRAEVHSDETLQTEAPGDHSQNIKSGSELEKCLALKNSSPKAFSVMSLNVLKAYKEDGQNRLPKLHKMISDIKPDVLALQEVYAKKGQESNPDTLEDFQKPLKAKGLNYWYYETGMILSRFPMESSNPFRPTGFYRNGGVRVKIPQGPGKPDFPVDVFSVHLPYQHAGWEILADSKNPASELAKAIDNSGTNDRMSALAPLLEHSRKNSVPTIIAGDFNSASHRDWNSSNPYLLNRYPFLKDKPVVWKESRLMLEGGFLDSFRDVNPISAKTRGATWSPLYKDAVQDRIDFIYHKSPGPQLKVLCSAVVGEDAFPGMLPFPSDHRGVFTVFEAP